jgi:hypothetical protein
MGTMTFLLPPGLSAEQARALEWACIAGGPDNMPWPTKVQIDAERLTVQRDVDESGYLVVPWEIKGAGQVMGTTATLMERSQPYHLQTELARGKVNQVRSQAAAWEAGGLPLTAATQDLIRAASLTFGRAVIEPDASAAAKYAQETLVHAYRAAALLTQASYIDPVFTLRHERDARLGTEMGCRLEGGLPEDTANLLLPACNGVGIPFPWSTIEANQGSFQWQPQDILLDWAEDHGLAVTGGPLIDFASSLLPSWLWLWGRDLPALFKFMSNYVTTTLRRYRRRIRRWHLTAASNSATVLSLGEEDLLWLTAKLAQAARQVDPDFELIVGIAQPWGEYLAHEDRTHSPFIFADTLIRSDLNLAALDLELVMGLTPRGSYCRDSLEAFRMLELYSLLGVPLRLTLAYPSAPGTDPTADPELSATAGYWQTPYSPAGQTEWARSFAALALCKPCVQALHWAQATDASPHLFPHSGLVDSQGRPKPALEALSRLRQEHLR